METQTKNLSINAVHSDVVILPTDPAYLDQLVHVQRTVYQIPPEHWEHPEVLTAEKFLTHMEVFPDGQFMALDIMTDTVVGTCASLIVDHDPSQPFNSTWRKTTADGTFRSHNPRGEWLYGADNVVLSSCRGGGVGGRLMQARYNVVVKKNLRGMLAGSMPIDYHKAAAEGLSIEAYIAEVVAGRRWDTNLSKQLKKGFRVLNAIPNYLTDAPDTANYGVAIVWDNPEYRAPFVVPQRPTAVKTPYVYNSGIST